MESLTIKMYIGEQKLPTNGYGNMLLRIMIDNHLNHRITPNFVLDTKVRSLYCETCKITILTVNA